MKNYNNKSKDRRDFPRKKFSVRERGRSLMHNAVCDECGKDCQVPFKPTIGKPIYCNECFEKKGRRNNNRPARRDSYERNYNDRAFRFRENKISNKTIDLLLEKVEALNSKLNTIIDLLTVGGVKKPKSEKSKKKQKKLKAESKSA